MKVSLTQSLEEGEVGLVLSYWDRIQGLVHPKQVLPAEPHTQCSVCLFTLMLWLADDLLALVDHPLPRLAPLYTGRDWSGGKPFATNQITQTSLWPVVDTQGQPSPPSGSQEMTSAHWCSSAFPFLVYTYLCGHVCMCACAYVLMCTCTWMPEVSLGSQSLDVHLI